MAFVLLHPSYHVPLQRNTASKLRKSNKRLIFSVSCSNSDSKTPDFKKCAAEFCFKSLKFAFSNALALGIAFTGVAPVDAKVGVNKPELLPKEFSPVIDVAGFLSTGQKLIPLAKEALVANFHFYMGVRASSAVGDGAKLGAIPTFWLHRTPTVGVGAWGAEESGKRFHFFFWREDIKGFLETILD